MPELYAGPTQEFVDRTMQNRIARDLKDAFFAFHGFNPSPSEERSWSNSLRALSNAITLGGFTDHGILLEYQLPLSSRRLDAMVTGHAHDGAPAAVIVELKQWTDCEPSTVDECVVVRYGGRPKAVLHPSAQARQYRDHLADGHTAFHDDAIRLDACAFLHDFMHDPGSELLHDRHAHLLGTYPLFPGDRVQDLVDFMAARLAGGRGTEVLRTIRDGVYRPHRKLLEHTADMIAGEPVYTLLDEQLVVMKSIVAKVTELADLDTKAVFVVHGGPGTGKSVLALNIVGELARHGYAVHHATGSSAFTNTVRKRVGRKASQLFTFFHSYLNAEEDMLDVLVCDEAHRIRRHSWNRFTKKRADDPDRLQIDELISAAKVGVYFIDDLQVVRRQELGSSDAIVEAARRADAEVLEHELEIQFRCGGSDGFVRWLENTLAIRRTANALWQGDPGFDFRIVDTPQDLDALIRARLAEGHSARLMAGYCWPWSDPLNDGTLVDDVEVDGWSRPWNARPDAGRLGPGIPQSHLWASEPGGEDQVGCIYTAQGFEFDYAGVIFGTDLVHRPREGWVGLREHSHDRGLKSGTDEDTFAELVKNTYRVLLSRGLKGCYVHFLDEQTRDFVESRIDLATTLDEVRTDLAAEVRPEGGMNDG